MTGQGWARGVHAVWSWEGKESGVCLPLLLMQGRTRALRTGLPEMDTGVLGTETVFKPAGMDGITESEQRESLIPQLQRGSQGDGQLLGWPQPEGPTAGTVPGAEVAAAGLWRTCQVGGPL